MDPRSRAPRLSGPGLGCGGDRSGLLLCCRSQGEAKSHPRSRGPPKSGRPPITRFADLLFLEHVSSRVLTLTVGRACLTVKRGKNRSFVHQPAIDRRYPLFRLCFYLAQSFAFTPGVQNYPINVTNRPAHRCASWCIATTCCVDL